MNNYSLLLDYLQSQGYSCITNVGGKVCGLKRFIFTTGLVVGLDMFGYEGRYCFENLSDATEALLTWDGTGHPSGNWIKYKGQSGEFSNPNNDANI
jgi:hypothetical protein